MGYEWYKHEAETLGQATPELPALSGPGLMTPDTRPATKDELIDYAIRSGAPIEVIENLQELEDEGEIYEGIEDIWSDYPSQDDFFFNEDEY